MKPVTNILARRTKTLARPGFSLLELMLVLVIIGILIGAVAYNIAGAGARAKAKLSNQMLETIATALKDYHLSFSSYPPTLETLVTTKYLDASKKLKDAWDSPFVYELRPHGTELFTLISAGEDKQAGTEDDIAYGTPASN
jgi:general secretion pathway protein G